MKIIFTALLFVLAIGSVYVYKNGLISPIETVRKDGFPTTVSNTLYKVQMTRGYVPLKSEVFTILPDSEFTSEKVVGRTFIFHTYTLQNVPHRDVYEKKGEKISLLLQSTNTVRIYKDTAGYVFVFENGQYDQYVYVVTNTSLKLIPQTKSQIRVCNLNICNSKEFEQIVY